MLITLYPFTKTYPEIETNEVIISTLSVLSCFQEQRL